MLHCGPAESRHLLGTDDKMCKGIPGGKDSVDRHVSRRGNSFATASDVKAIDEKALEMVRGSLRIEE